MSDHAGWRSRIPGWVEVLALLAVALVAVFLIKTFVVQAFYIPSGSMQETLQVGDRVLVNKLLYHFRDVERGDVIVFDGAGIFTPEVSGGDERDFIKRVIGTPGDRVMCCDPQGRLTVNGVALDENAYLYPGNPPSLTRFDVIVPAERLWVMGDHRSASSDSRAHMGDPGGGFVPLSRVIGRAFAVVWPLSNAGILEIPSTFEQPGLGGEGNGGG